MEDFDYYFSKHLVFIEQYVEQSILDDALLPFEPLPTGWKDITLFDNVVQIEAVRLFYTNIFETMVYGIDIHIDPNFIATILKIYRPSGPSVSYPPASLKNKEIVALLGYPHQHWYEKLHSIECNMPMRLLNLIFSNTLFPTTYDNEMSDNMVWIVYNILAQHEVDVPTIIFHTMITEAGHTKVKTSLLYGVMITILIASCGVRLPEDALVLKQGVQINQTSIVWMESAREALKAQTVEATIAA